MRISDWSSVVCSSDLSGAKNDLLLRQLSVKQATGDTLAVTLAADVDGNEIAAEGTLGSLAELMGPSRPWPVKLAVTVPGATANVDRKSTSLNSRQSCASRMPTSA